jgi:RHS repeat-associated protein
MKRIYQYIIAVLFFITGTLQAQTPAVINKSDYTVTGNETLTASQNITISPTSLIKSGSTFAATINQSAYIPLTFSNENYIFTRSFQVPMTTVSGIVNNSDVIENISYFDGLGRSMQKIDIKSSPSMQDIVTHVSYDEFGREFRDHLPYMDTSSIIASYKTAAETNTNTYYSANFPLDIDTSVPNPFSQKQYEPSPLKRIVQQGGPGKDWALGTGHEVKADYQTNILNEVKYYVVSTTTDASGLYIPTIINSSNYDPGQLTKTIIKDENWTSGNNNTTEEFKDNRDNVVLKRTYNGGVAHDTYYVYDIFGNLTYVLPPKANGAITDSVLNELCYQYRYDSRNRLAEKKLPGKDWEYTIYDKLDRLILIQDANLRIANKWMFTKYDAFNRTVYTGEYVNATQITRAAVQALASSAAIISENKQSTALTINGTSVNYTNNTFPNTGIDLLTITYYDDYLNINLDGGGSVSSYGVTPITNAKELTTCNKVRILGTTSWTTTVNYYDTEGRSIYYYSNNNYLGTVNTIKNQLDFGGKLLETTKSHIRTNVVPNVSINIVDVFKYDHMGRLLTQKQTINNQQPELILSNGYDNLGQLISKGVGGQIGQSRLQTVDYSYNIRGWLKNINDISAIGTDLFALKINYNAPTTGTGLFNGNISQTQWKTTNTDSSLKSYLYSYDSLNRLTLANDVSTNNPGRYNESLGYDKNGNITNLTRLGNTNLAATTFGNMDILTYTYDSGNKLIKVEDTGSIEGFNNGVNVATEYTYDLNGNMKTDTNKGITSIIYNYLNLPTKVNTGSGTIDYVYDATGAKQKKIVSTGITTDYADNFIYENNTLQFFSQPEGYVANNLGTFNYIYQYKDHLGNVRLSYDKNLSIIEENNYYPFGLKQKGYNIVINTGGNAIAQKYKYNGKEEQTELGLNMYDYGARNYDPALGRWIQIDPVTELMRSISPYGYAFNNPSYFADFEGLIPWPVPAMFKNWYRRVDSWFGGPRHCEGCSEYHKGLDFNFSGGGDTDYGAPVVATHSGVIVSVKTTTSGSAGRIVLIGSKDGSFRTRYIHLSSVAVQKGDEISEGQTIGAIGGSSYGKEYGRPVHLHYEIYKQNSKGDYDAYDPTEDRSHNINNIVDPQSWVKSNNTSIFNKSFDNPQFDFSGITNIQIPTITIPQTQNKSNSRAPLTPVNKLTTTSTTPGTNTSPQTGAGPTTVSSPTSTKSTVPVSHTIQNKTIKFL